MLMIALLTIDSTQVIIIIIIIVFKVSIITSLIVLMMKTIGVVEITCIGNW